MRKEWLGALSLTLAASIWGGMYVVSKYALAYIEPFTFVWLRYAVAFMVLFVVWFRFGRESIRRADWKWIGLVGVIGYVASISFQLIGTKLSDAHTGSLVTAAMPPTRASGCSSSSWQSLHVARCCSKFHSFVFR